MTSVPLDIRLTTFSLESMINFWSTNPALSKILYDLQNKSLITLISSPFAGRSLFLDAIKSKLLSDLVIKISLKKNQQNEDCDSIWKYLLIEIVKVYPLEISTSDERDFIYLLSYLGILLEKQTLYLLIDDIDALQFRSDEKDALENIFRLTEIPNLHILLAGSLYPCGENNVYDFPFHEIITPLDLTEYVNKDSLSLYIIYDKILTLTPGAQRQILEDAGKELVLVQRLCGAAVSFLENRPHDEELTAADVLDIESELVNHEGYGLFQEFWLSLCYFEQLTLLCIKAIDEPTRTPDRPIYFSIDHFNELLDSYIAIESSKSFLNINFSSVCKLLCRRKILYYDERIDKYIFTNNLFNLWLHKIENPDKYLARIMSKGFATIIRNIAYPLDNQDYSFDLERWLINSCLPKETHNKIQFFRDINYILNPSSSGNKPVILHISDLQFGEPHAFIPDPDHKRSLCSELLNDINNNYESLHLERPNIIVISGDLTDSALPEEYDDASNFINTLSQKLDIDYSRVIIVPGNHDVNFLISNGISRKFNSETGEYDECEEWQKRRIYHSRMAPFETFINNFYQSKRRYSIKNTSKSSYSIFDLTEKYGLIVVGFDSCSCIDHKRKAGNICVEDIKSSEEEISKFYSNAVYKVALWHHNVSSIDGRDDFLTNWFEVQEYLFKQYSYQLGLHGHLHRPEIEYRIRNIDSEMSNKGWIIGAGTIGLKESKRAGDPDIGHMPLSYNLIQFGIDGITEKIRLVVREAHPYNTTEPIKWRSGVSVPDISLPQLKH